MIHGDSLWHSCSVGGEILGCVPRRTSSKAFAKGCLIPRNSGLPYRHSFEKLTLFFHTTRLIDGSLNEKLTRLIKSQLTDMFARTYLAC